ncbi:hypothetical protein M430DRAFT_91016, partial [Amorphotheca resinae ATCC 22711]
LPSSSISSVSTSTTATSPAPSQSSQPSQSSAASYFQKAYREARHFAGGLIEHPTESTKHFTILRHSHGLVFYQGTSTSIAISIFADAPLPPDRTLWLQSKGWTGKTGMRVKALMGQNGDWLNVTPTMAVGSQQLNPSDERAWQRDIKAFYKKAHSNVRDHKLRETAVVRIPAEAGDGYFQIVLCVGSKKKVLCPSPVFRVFSTSSDPSSIRGASLSTLPLELGAMVLSTGVQNTVGAYIAPVTEVVQTSVEKYMPSWWTQQAAIAAVGVSGVGDKLSTTLEDANNEYDQKAGMSLAGASSEGLSPEGGPQPPYPIRFGGRSQPNQTSNEITQSHLLAFTLSNVDDAIIQKLYGYYFGWVRVLDKFSTDPSTNHWYQSVISCTLIDASQLTRVNLAQANKRTITLRLLHGLSSPPPERTPIDVLIMGFIRPDEPAQRAGLARGLQAGDQAAIEAAHLSESNDVALLRTFLDHPAWAPELPPPQAAEETRKLDKAKMGYANTRLAVQKKIDKVPLHKMGIRTQSDLSKEKTVVTSGFYVVR